MNGIKPALITPGDPSGIGPEIALKAWSEGQKNIVLMGDIEHLSSVALAAGLDIAFTTFDPAANLSAEKCSVWAIDWKIMPLVGQPDPRNAPTIVDAPLNRLLSKSSKASFRLWLQIPLLNQFCMNMDLNFQDTLNFLPHLTNQRVSLS